MLDRPLIAVIGFILTVSALTFGCRGQRQIVTQQTRPQATVDKVYQSTDSAEDAGPPVDKVRDPEDAEDTTDKNFNDSPMTPGDAVLKGKCRTELNYDPKLIPCALPANMNQTIWDRVEGFATLVAGLKHPEASWLGIAEPVTVPAVEQAAYDYCPFSPYADKAVFVSHFRLTAKTEVTMEALADDAAIVRLWQNADPRQAVFESAKGMSISATVTLNPGFYTIILTVEDKAQGAFGGLFTAFQKDGTVLRQTEDSPLWCAYRLSSETNLSDFLRAAAACQPCMTGVDSTP